MDLRHIFATNLRRLRHGSGFSQEELAYQAGVNRSYMSKVETGRTYVGLEVIERLAIALEIDPVEFFRKPKRKPTRARAS